ncbi:hypothetical protein [Massilia alkalitolerans]|uniref:hypothetical protein n=1 Tax=Massilia alkalitolerans TaxID=286638 RepID=UPI003FCEDD3F
MRHRLRAIHLKQWRCGPTIYRELRKLGGNAESRCSGCGEQPQLVAQQQACPEQRPDDWLL